MTGEIKCSDQPEFLDMIEGLVQRGLVFEADAATLKIKLTGGY